MILRLRRSTFSPSRSFGKSSRTLTEAAYLPIAARVGRNDSTAPLLAEDEGPLALEDAPSALSIPVSFIRELNEFGLVVIVRSDSGRGTRAR